MAIAPPSMSPPTSLWKKTKNKYKQNNEVNKINRRRRIPPDIKQKWTLQKIRETH